MPATTIIARICRLPRTSSKSPVLLMPGARFPHGRLRTATPLRPGGSSSGGESTATGRDIRESPLPVGIAGSACRAPRRPSSPPAELASEAGAPSGSGRCCSLDDVYDARRVAEQIGIPYYVVNFERQFEEHVVKPFVEEYLAGCSSQASC